MALPKFERGQVWLNESGSIFIVVKDDSQKLIPVWIAHTQVSINMGICYSNWESMEKLFNAVTNSKDFKLLGTLDEESLNAAFRKVLHELPT